MYICRYWTTYVLNKLLWILLWDPPPKSEQSISFMNIDLVNKRTRCIS